VVCEAVLVTRWLISPDKRASAGPAEPGGVTAEMTVTAKRRVEQ
jgi:hypothetical protein